MSPENETRYVEVQLGYLRSLFEASQFLRWCALITTTAVIVFGLSIINTLSLILRALEATP